MFFRLLGLSWSLSWPLLGVLAFNLAIFVDFFRFLIDFGSLPRHPDLRKSMFFLSKTDVFHKIMVFFLDCSWDSLGTLSAPSWDPLGTLLGRSWPLLDALGALPGRPGASKKCARSRWSENWTRQKTKKNGFFPLLLLLGRSWPCLGPSWPHLGTSRAHLEGSWAVFWFPHGLPREIPTTVPGKVVIPGFQERPWESLLAFGH